MGKQQIQVERVENTHNEPLWRIFTTPNPRNGSIPRQASLNLTEIVKAMGYKNQDMFLPQIFLQSAEAGNQALDMNRMKQMLMEGGMGGGTGGQTIRSIAGGGAGAAATTNPAGAGLQVAAGQLGAGGMVQGLRA